MTELRIENIEIPGARVGLENPLPFFRDKKVNIEVPVRETVDAEKRRYFGNASGKRVLPYRMQDNYTRVRMPYSMQVAVLENEFLKATFWIELGCRMMSLIYKPLQRELLFNNPVFQPANLALRNAWFSGGVEWNVGQVGHTFFTCSPLFVARINGLEGEPGLRIYEYERCKNLFWHTDFYLPDNSHFLIAFTRVINSQYEDTSLYWWTNIAVPETADVRVLAPTSEAVYIDREIKGFGQAQLPLLPTYLDRDATYPINSPHASEFFFQCQKADIPWEAALDRNGEGLIEASTPRLCVRKLFCWGMHQGGRHWQEFLSIPGKAYTEIQAGLAPTQLHSLPIEAGGKRHWTEVFGYIKADPAKVHGADWQEAWRTVDNTLKTRISANDLAEIEGKCLLQADNPPIDLFQTGSGWGALELARRSSQKKGFELPATFVFPLATLGREQRKWLSLLEDGKLPEQPPEQIPGDWMVQSQWRELLGQSLESEENQNWYALLHYGVMLAEVFSEPAAIAAWEKSIAKTPSIWAYRNLAVMARSTGKTVEALDLYHKAWELAISTQQYQAGFAQEYLSLLNEAGEFQKAWDVCQSLPPEALDLDPVQILRASIALQVGRLDEAELALQREYASIREGAVILTDLWIDLWRRKIAAETGRSPVEISRQEIETAHPAPAGIDFRSAQ
jgi:tetratricopeptide (TPR) repeat protein